MAYSNLGDAYLKLIRIDKAIQSYNNAIRIQQSSQTYNKLALCYKIKGDVLFVGLGCIGLSLMSDSCNSSIYYLLLFYAKQQ